MDLVRRSCRLEALLLIDADTVTDSAWDDHVNQVQAYLGDITWEGGPTGLYIEPVGKEPIEAGMGEYLIKETWRNGDVEFSAITEAEFLAKYEVA